MGEQPTQVTKTEVIKGKGPNLQGQFQLIMANLRNEHSIDHPVNWEDFRKEVVRLTRDFSGEFAAKEIPAPPLSITLVPKTPESEYDQKKYANVKPITLLRIPVDDTEDLSGDRNSALDLKGEARTTAHIYVGFTDKRPVQISFDRGDVHDARLPGVNVGASGFNNEEGGIEDLFIGVKSPDGTINVAMHEGDIHNEPNVNLSGPDKYIAFTSPVSDKRYTFTTLPATPEIYRDALVKNFDGLFNKLRGTY